MINEQNIVMEQHVVEEYHTAMIEALVEKEVVVPLQQTPRNMEKEEPTSLRVHL